MGTRFIVSLYFCCVVVLVILSERIETFRLKAHFPRQPLSSAERLAKKSECKFCVYETKYLNQKLDHFNYDRNETFKQRYLVSDIHWEKGGPILFYCGNEGDITWFCNNTGFMWDIAKEFKAMLVFGEHRFYGKSMPFGKKSYESPKHLGFLTSEQALADFAFMLQHVKETYSGARKSPVIAMGGSYGGMLAAWFRMKYPNVVVGAIAASAPIVQFQDLTPCETFYNIVSRDFAREGQSCFNLIKKSWSVILDKGMSKSGRNELSDIFHLCKPLKKMTDVYNFRDWLSGTYVNLAMVNYPYPASFLEPLPGWPIKAVCKNLKDEELEGDALLKAVFNAISVYYNYTGVAKCFDINQQATKDLGDKGWNFQACTEMVMPLCANGNDDMFYQFDWDFPAYAKGCEKSYGVKPSLFWAEIQYGGKKISSHSNIVFSNGDLDPWSGGGITKSISDTLVAVVIKNGAHHLDLRHKNKDDPQSVIDARNLEKKYMKKWIIEWKKLHRKLPFIKPN
ncbi:lysosomal Pro-X carboxypeptidase-like [Xenia sp. Carnegie-2017]|uniref:lysosomal Pro-X carboxypeptidase-like n=1 Tax=Xenia sp. Carnegie-2017 TaxID=2897299 RepID=UPI001F04E00D|nr:lysosomal Pro-X carboxypeptidase-like [Xenia sp. Carnegie-2017]